MVPASSLVSVAWARPTQSWAASRAAMQHLMAHINTLTIIYDEQLSSNGMIVDELPGLNRCVAKLKQTLSTGGQDCAVVGSYLASKSGPHVWLPLADTWAPNLAIHNL